MHQFFSRMVQEIAVKCDRKERYAEGIAEGVQLTEMWEKEKAHVLGHVKRL